MILLEAALALSRDCPNIEISPLLNYSQGCFVKGMAMSNYSYVLNIDKFNFRNSTFLKSLGLCQYYVMDVDSSNYENIVINVQAQTIQIPDYCESTQISIFGNVVKSVFRNITFLGEIEYSRKPELTQNQVSTAYFGALVDSSVEYYNESAVIYRDITPNSIRNGVFGISHFAHGANFSSVTVQNYTVEQQSIRLASGKSITLAVNQQTFAADRQQLANIIDTTSYIIGNLSLGMCPFECGDSGLCFEVEDVPTYCTSNGCGRCNADQILQYVAPNFQCTTSCPPGSFIQESIYCTNSCAPSQAVYENICYNTCPPPTGSISGRCQQCAAPTPYYQDGYCAAGCMPLQMVQGFECVYECSNYTQQIYNNVTGITECLSCRVQNKVTYVNGSSFACKDSCEPLYNNSWMCQDTCPDLYYQNYDHNCTETCDAYIQGDQCVQQCARTKVLYVDENNTRHCLDQCPDGLLKQGQACVDRCSFGLTNQSGNCMQCNGFVDEQQCLTSCPQRLYFIINGIKFCTATCAANETQIYVSAVSHSQCVPKYTLDEIPSSCVYVFNSSVWDGAYKCNINFTQNGNGQIINILGNNYEQVQLQINGSTLSGCLISNLNVTNGTLQRTYYYYNSRVQLPDTCTTVFFYPIMNAVGATVADVVIDGEIQIVGRGVTRVYYGLAQSIANSNFTNVVMNVTVTAPCATQYVETSNTTGTSAGYEFARVQSQYFINGSVKAIMVTSITSRDSLYDYFDSCSNMIELARVRVEVDCLAANKRCFVGQSSVVCTNQCRCQRCAVGQMLQNGACVDRCSNNYYIQSGICVQRCSNGYIQYGQQCLRQCPYGMVLNSSQCVWCGGLFAHQNQCIESCPVPYYNLNNSCIRQCDDGYKPTQTFQCEKCPKKYYQGACLETCPSRTYDQYNICVPQCTFANTQQNATCVAECQGSTQQNYICIADNCSVGTYTDGQYCQRNCTVLGPYSKSVACVAECPEGYLTNNKSRKCYLACNQGEYYDIIGDRCALCSIWDRTIDECVHSCSYYNITATQEICEVPGSEYCEVIVADNPQKVQCLHQCPSTKYIRVENQLSICVDQCDYYDSTQQMCVEQDNCTVYEIDDGKKVCHQSCSATSGKPYQHGRQCYASCPQDVPLHYQNMTCTANCTGMYRNGSTCLDTCEPDAHHNQTMTCSSNCSYIVSNNRKYCVDSCPDSMQFVNGRQCVASCPSWYDVIDGVKTCVSDCGSKYINGTECVQSCAPGAVNVTSKKCSTTCTYEVINGTKQCVASCPDRFPYLDGLECKARCDAYYVNTSGVPICTNSCLPLAISADNTSCEENCQSFVQSEIRYCTNGTCPDSHPYVSGNTCLNVCSHFWRPSGGRRVCVDQCAPGEFVKDKECVSSCDSIYEVIGGLKTCVSACSTQNPFLNGTQCTSSCGSMMIDNTTNTCVANCTYVLVGTSKYCTTSCASTNKPYLDVNQCVASCSRYYDTINGVATCVDDCDGQNKFILGQQCVYDCGDNLVQTDGKTCIPKCPHYAAVVDGLVQCVENCNEGQYIQNNTFCVDACTEGTCIMVCNGTPICDGRYCLPDCQSGSPLPNNTCMEGCNNGMIMSEAGCSMSVQDGMLPFMSPDGKQFAVECMYAMIIEDGYCTCHDYRLDWGNLSEREETYTPCVGDCSCKPPTFQKPDY